MAGQGIDKVELPRVPRPANDDDVGECTPSPPVPTDWQAVTSSGWGWGRRLVLNGYYEDENIQLPLPFLPSCPQDGPNYANTGTITPTIVEPTSRSTNAFHITRLVTAIAINRNVRFSHA